MRIPSPYPRKRARIEIIPLIDIMFFLLATFIMVSLSMIQNKAIPLNLPGAASASPQLKKPSVSISVNKSGEIFWDKERIVKEEMNARLANLASSDPEARVFVHGDKEAGFGTIVSVLDDVRGAGIRQVGIRTKGRKESKP